MTAGPAAAENRANLGVPHEGYGWRTASHTRYIYDGWRVIQERDQNNTPAVSYTRGNDLSGSLEGAGGIGGLLARSHGYSGGNWSTHNFYHADGNGNITFMLNGSQTMVARYRYDPFGNTISSSGSLATANTYRFSSKEIHVNSGMYYYGYRFYDPSLQRWVNRDPIGEEGFDILRGLRPKRGSAIWAGPGYIALESSSNRSVIDTEPNAYKCVKNGPINQVDPDGLKTFWQFYRPWFFAECGVGAALGISDALVSQAACDELKPGQSAYILTRLGRFMGIFAGSPVWKKVCERQDGDCHSTYFYTEPVKEA